MEGYCGFFTKRTAPAGGPVPSLFSPPSAGREGPRPALLTDTWHTMQGTQGYSTRTDTRTQVIRFSGFPDRIEIWVRDNPAIIRFLDEQGRPLQDIRIEAGVFYEPNIRGHSVSARNATAGLNAQIQVVGKWARS